MAKRIQSQITFLLALILCLLSSFSTYGKDQWDAPPSQGSYHKSCDDCKIVNGHVLVCSCKGGSGMGVLQVIGIRGSIAGNTQLDLKECDLENAPSAISNCGGKLKCHGEC